MKTTYICELLNQPSELFMNVAKCIGFDQC